MRSSRSWVSFLELLAGDLDPRGAGPGSRRPPTALLRAESVRLASSHSRHSLPAVLGSSRGSTPCSRMNSSATQVDQPLVPVVAAQLHVAVGGQGDELACRGSPSRSRRTCRRPGRRPGSAAARRRCRRRRGSPAGSRRPRPRRSAR